MNLISRKEAKAQGLKFYFTGKPCKHRHVCPRRVSSKCCTGCEKQFYDKNKTEILKSRVEYSKRNKNKISEYQKKYRENNKNRTSEYLTDYFQKNKEEIYLQRRQYIERNKAYFFNWHSEYREKHRDIFNVRSSIRRAIKLQAIPTWANKTEIHEFYKDAVRISYETGVKYNVDHIVPLQSDFVCGLHWEGNLQILTKTENLSKSNRHWPDMPDTSDPEIKHLVKQFKKMNKYLSKIAEAYDVVEGNNGASIGRKGGSTLDGKDQKTTPASVRNRMLEAGRASDPDQPVNMGSVTGGYSDPGILGS